jgi:O-antigen ligase
MRRGQNCLKINGVLGWLILFYIIWASLSLTWADDAALTLRRILALWMLCFGALAMGKHFSLRDIILWIFFTTAFYLLVGLAVEIALGTFRPFAPSYRFAGTIHPNTQGANCSLLLLSGLTAGRVAKRGRWFFVASACMGFVFLILTGSRAASASAIAALLVYWALVSSRSRKLAWILGISIGVCLLVLFYGDSLFQALRQGVLLGRTGTGEDPSSLTGRIPLWKDCLDYAARQPLQGYGYNSFFTPSRTAKFGATHGWAFAHTHSAYFESLLGTGMVGMISFVMVLVLGIKSSIDHYKGSLIPGYACFIAIFIFCLLNGVLEATIVRANMLSFVAMVVLGHLGFTIPKARTSRTLERKGVRYATIDQRRDSPRDASLLQWSSGERNISGSFFKMISMAEKLQSGVFKSRDHYQLG